MIPPIMAGSSSNSFINRELSWLEFNQRVLDEALNPATPLLERLKFFCIVSSNLDEFFEVRMAGVKQQMESDVVERSIDGRTATETYRDATRRVRKLVEQQYDCWRNELLPGLAKQEIRFLDIHELSPTDLSHIQRFYRDKVFPVLTPLGIDPAHPFPQLLNKSLNIVVLLDGAGGPQSSTRSRRLAVVQVPRNFNRLVPLPRKSSRQAYVFLDRVIMHFLGDLFAGHDVLGHWTFRVTRNSELYIDEEDVINLLKAVEQELHNRRKGDAVRLELEKGCPADVRNALIENLSLDTDDVYQIDGPLSPSDLMSAYSGDHSPELRDAPFVAPKAKSLRNTRDYFSAIRRKDHLLHHPYESFDTVVEFLNQAANDPDVLAIKQTLYRTGGDTRIVGALMQAVKLGKQVTAVVELKARFDEANNIEWSRRLERAGVHVVYGLVGYKIHCKVTLVVRNESDGIRRYLHLGTGNYNASTAKLYTDLGLLTCRPEFGEDATNLFNVLTGLCQFHGARKFLVAPFTLHASMLSKIHRETEFARKGVPARIIARMNSLVDPVIIDALYEASRAGVQIDLIVRGICCLRPGVKGQSENIRVRSIVGRFLEHSRIYYFENACNPEVFLGSADWMPRNFFRRIEVVFPIEDGVLRDRLIRECLGGALADNCKARFLQPNGQYVLPALEADQEGINSQEQFMKLATAKDKATKGSRSPFPRVELAPAPASDAPTA